MLCVCFTGAGGNEVIELQERPDPQPGAQELLIRVRYAGLNPADVAQRDGNYPPPPLAPVDIPGLEVSGVIDSSGPQALRFSAGQRVFGLIAGGGLADRVVVHERLVAPVPDQLTDEQAAAVPEVFITAHDALHTRGRLASGETLVVQGANGGVGAAAVQIGGCFGARTLGVVRTEETAGFVRDLGAEPVQAASFPATVRELTGGEGADLILELVGAVNFPGNISALAERGRIVVVGVGSGPRVVIDLMQLMRHRAELHATVLRARPLEEKADAVRGFERHVLPHLGSGRVRPTIDKVFPADEVRQAFDRLAGPGKKGKVLIDFGG